MPRLLTAAVLAVALLLAACGDDGDDATSDTTETAEPAGPAPGADNTPEEDQAAIDAVEVVPGADGQAPALEFEPPLGVASTVRRILAEGSGEEAADGSRVVFQFLMVNGRDGATLSSSYDSRAADVVLDDQLLPGVRTALTGLQAGTEALVAIAPVDAFAGQGNAGGVNEDDTILMHIVVERVSTPLKRAEGTAVAPPDGLPEVALDESGKPTITVPGGEPPTELVAQPLIEGAGPVVEAGQSITVHYTGVLWDGGQQFDSSWDRGSPASFGIGVGDVIAGWDEGLVGRTVGSQVLLVIPPDKAYGDRDQGTIPPGSTLVFVVDILDAG